MKEEKKLPEIELISRSYNMYGWQTETVKLQMPQTPSLPDLLDLMERFIRASGFNLDGHLEIVSEEKVVED